MMPWSPHELVDRLTGRLAPLERELQEAYWAAATDARPETTAARARAEAAWLAALADRELFEEVEDGLARLSGAEPLLARALAEARRELLANQVPDDLRPELVRLQAKVEAAFSTVRGQVGGHAVSNNEIDDVLARSGDPAERRAHWEAGKQVGAAVADDLLALVELRNRIATGLGYRDWFAFSLATGDLDEAWLDATLGEVELATRAPFLAAKGALDQRLAARFGVAPDELRPWHYGDLFFQRADGEGEADLSPLLAGRDNVELAVAAYDGMGLETRPVLARSDLHPRPGKDQHAFCLDVDRARDVRVLANVAPGEQWLDTMLHELGHAVYEDHLASSLPWLLRRPPHALSTEAVALMLGRLRRDPEFLVGVAGADAGAARALADASREVLRTGMLVFARWCLVMVRFEQAMYADPGRDLAAAWWDLVEELQGVHRPDGRTAPDWASKIHLAVSPVYYQNYLLGELLASQLDAAVRERCGGFVGRPEAGAFLVDRVFSPGASFTWTGLVESATGRRLTPEAFVAGLGR
ncbi:MAG TPA: M2 family metallopeptidase [Actinomycetota bacterium]|nr:M2 family metallopeptidase [Actinomycetota bacterium]